MYIENFIKEFMIIVISGLLYIIVIFVCENKINEKKDIIEKVKDYEVYDKCHYMDEQYYCYNLEKVKN